MERVNLKRVSTTKRREEAREEGVAEKWKGREGRKGLSTYLEFLIGPVSVWNYNS